MNTHLKTSLFIFTMIMCGASSAYSMTDDPLTVTLTPVKHGFGPNTGGPKSPEENICPLSLFYNQTIDQLEFENTDASSITFSYYIFDEDDNMVCYDTICINGNASYLLNLNSVSGETYTIQLDVNDIMYEGTFGL